MSEQKKDKTVTATIWEKVNHSCMTTNAFKLEAMISQLQNNDLEYLVVGGIVIPKQSISFIEFTEVEE